MLLKKRIDYVKGFEKTLEKDIIYIYDPESFYFDMEDVGKSFIKMHVNKLIRTYCDTTEIKYNETTNIKNDEPIGIVEHLFIGDTNDINTISQHYTIVMLYTNNHNINNESIYLGCICFIYDSSLKDDHIFNIRIDCSNELPIIKEKITDKVICNNLIQHLKDELPNSLLEL